ncbi:hypothetical protein [Cohnella panacarvi]|uniref:hypothetical protein n=1 Tax=Cohnella panacarvi TaxID=400776 RepID=UPI00047AACD3|nr:hypothetical protein [Cohnella panacarvi]
MKWMMRRIFIGVLVFAIVYTLFYYNFVFSRTVAVVSIIGKNDKTITVKFHDGHELNVKTLSIVYPLVEIGENYAVSIYRNKLRDPFLHRINVIKE